MSLNQYLLRVLDRAKIDEDEGKKNFKIMEEFTDALISAMRSADPLFNDLYQRKSYTGSYYDGLRVKRADEFDLTLVLQLPFEKDEVQILRNVAGKVQFQVAGDVDSILRRSHQKWRSDFYQRLSGFFYPSGIVSQSKILQWIQAVMVKALSPKYFQRPHSISKINPKSGNHIMNYEIYTIYGTKIDIDLIPVITADSYTLPQGIDRSHLFNNLWPKYQELFLVCKLPGNPSDTQSDQNFQMDFILAERQLLNKAGGCLKNMIKLFKLLRDKYEWNDQISSFHIKCFFLLYFDQSIWDDDRLGTLFLEMLLKFKTAIEQRRLPYYFDRRDNLWKGMDIFKAQIIARKLESIESDVKLHPSNVDKYM